MSTANKVPLKSIASFSKGEQISGDLLLKDGEYPYLNGGINPSGMWNEYNVEADTVTVSEGGNSCGYVNYMDTPFWCGAHCYYLYDVKCDVKFLYHALKSSQNKLMSLRSGACMPNIKKKDLGEFELPEPPPLEIQREIAYNLDKVSEAIELCRKILERLDYLVKAKFTEMFGDINLSKERDSWTPISQIGTVVGGATPKTNVPEYWDGEYRWITPAELDNAAGYIYDSERKLTKAGVESCSLQELPVGTVILSSRAPIGKVAIAGATFYCNQGFKNIICGDSVNPIYLYTLLKYNTDYLNSLGRGATFKEISKSIVNNIKIPVPPLPLQEQFAEYVKKTDIAKSAVKKSLEKAETLKSALMQKYFG